MRFRCSLFVVVLLAASLSACGGDEEGGRIAATPDPGVGRVLFLTGGGYHDFVIVPRTLMEGLAEQPDLDVRLMPLDPEGVASHEISDTPLLTEEVDVILAYTQGQLPLSPASRDLIMAAIEGGVGFVGLHCAADSHPGWNEYDQMLGGRFESHPPLGPVTVTVDDPEHPVTAGLPAEWELIDEFYHLQGYSPAGKDVLMTGVSPAGGERRPVTWAKTHGEGRVVYTILGHTRDVHADANFRQLVAQALRWAGTR
jgi:type 1 glutamine amidotransferase